MMGFYSLRVRENRTITLRFFLILFLIVLTQFDVRAAETLLSVDWEQEPQYTWDHDSGWGNQHAVWDRPDIGAVGKCLRARHATGDCQDNRGFAITDLTGRLNHRLRIRISMACPTGSGKQYWMETSYNTFSSPPPDYGADYEGGNWKEVKWFDAAEWPEFPDGNDNTWTEYSVTFTLKAGENIVAIGFESASVDGTGGAPDMRWDTLIVEDLDGGAIPPTLTPTPTYTSSSTPTSGPPTHTYTITSTWTRTPTPTITSTRTSTWTRTFTNTHTPTRTFTRTWTITKTYTQTFTPTLTNTYPPTNTYTPTPTSTPTEEECEWEKPQIQLSPQGANCNTPSVSIDGLKRAHVVWKNSDFSLWYARVGPKNVIEIPAKAISVPDSFRLAKVVADETGYAHIVAQPKDSKDYLTYLRIEPVSTATVAQGEYLWPSIDWDPLRGCPVVGAQVTLTAQLSKNQLDPDGIKATYYRYSVTTVPLDSTGFPVESGRVDHFLRSIDHPDVNHPAQFPDTVVDSMGRAHGVWKHHETSWAALSHVYGYGNPGAQDGWADLADTREAFTNSYGGPELAKGTNGMLESIFVHRPSGKVYYQRFLHDYTKVGANLLVSSTETAYAKAPDIGAGEGTVVGAWTDDGRGQYLYLKRIVPDEKARLVTNCGPTFNVSVDVRDSGSADLVWEDLRNGYSAIYYCSVSFVKGKSNLRGFVTKKNRDGTSGGVIKDATVSIPDTATVHTDSQGHYEIADLSPDSYLVTASKKNFKRQTRSITLNAFQTQTLNFALIQGSTVPQFIKYTGTGKHFLPHIPPESAGHFPAAEWTFSEIVDFNDQSETSGNRSAFFAFGSGSDLTMTIKSYAGDPYLNVIEWVGILPQEISSCYTDQYTALNKAGYFGYHHETYFHPYPPEVVNWYRGLDDKLEINKWNRNLALVQLHRVFFKKKMGLLLFELKIPPQISPESIGFSATLQVENDRQFDTLAGSFDGKVKATLEPGFSIEIAEHDIGVTGSFGGAGGISFTFEKCNVSPLTRSLSLEGDIEFSVAAPVADLFLLVAPEAAPVFAIPVVKEIVGFVKGGIAISQGGQITILFTDGVTGQGWLGSTGLNTSVRMGISPKMVFEAFEQSVTLYGKVEGEPIIETNFQKIYFKELSVSGVVGYNIELLILRAAKEYPVFKKSLFQQKPKADLCLKDLASQKWEPLLPDFTQYGEGHRLAPETQVKDAKLNNSTVETVVENVYGLAAPQISVASQEVNIIFSKYDETKPPLEAQDISMARKVEGGNWTLSPVSTETPPEFNPFAAPVSGNKILAAWNSVIGAPANATNPLEIYPYLELMVSLFDRRTSTWSSPFRLTNNAFSDRRPTLLSYGDSTGLFFIRNMAGAPIGSPTQEDRLLLLRYSSSGWDSQVRLWGAAKPLLSYSVCADSNGLPRVAFAIDEDGSLDTLNDRELYLTQFSGSSWTPAQRLTNDNVADECPQWIAPNGQPILVWRKGGTWGYSSQPGNGPDPVFPTSQPQTTPSILYAQTMGSGAAIVFPGETADGGDLFGAFYDSGSGLWSLPIQLTEGGENPTSISTAYDGTNLLVCYKRVTFNRTTVNIPEGDKVIQIENVPSIGQRDIRLLHYTLGYDPAILPGSIRITPANPAPSGIASISATVINAGGLPISAMEVAFYDGDPASGGLLISKQLVTGPWVGGATAVVTTPWQIPDSDQSHLITVVVDPDTNIVDVNRGNNTDQSLFILPDIIPVKIEAGEAGPGQYIIEGVIFNDGSIPGNAFKAEFHVQSPNGTILNSFDVNGLPAAGTTSVSFLWDTNLSVYESSIVSVYLVVDPQDNVLEANEDNNVAFLSVEAVNFNTPTPSPSPLPLTPTTTPSRTPTPSRTTTPSRTLTPTATALPNNRFDLNSDKKINVLDLLLFLEYRRSGDPRGDLNSDGSLDSTDLYLFTQHYGKSLS